MKVQIDLPWVGPAPQMETIFHAIRAQHYAGQDARIFAPDAATLAKDLAMIFSECEVGTVEHGNGRCSAYVCAPGERWSSLPADLRALSLTQPWGWLVASGHKDIENRTAGFSHKSFLGLFLIHASANMPQSAYQAALDMAIENGLTVPNRADVQLGGIIGIARMVDMIPPGPSGRRWHSPDQHGFVVKDARPLPFIPCKGLQGFWRVPPKVRAAVEKALAST